MPNMDGRRLDSLFVYATRDFAEQPGSAAQLFAYYAEYSEDSPQRKFGVLEIQHQSLQL